MRPFRRRSRGTDSTRQSGRTGTIRERGSRGGGSEPRRPALRVVTPKPRRRRRFPFLVASFVVVGSLVTAVVTTQALVSQTSFRMEELNREASELRNEHGRLMLSVAELSSPERVYHEALRLGLRHPAAPPVVVFVPDESASGGDLAGEGGGP